MEEDVGTLEDLGEVLEEKKINLNEMDIAIEPGVDPAELEDEWKTNQEYMENIPIRRNKIKRFLCTIVKMKAKDRRDWHIPEAHEQSNSPDWQLPNTMEM